MTIILRGIKFATLFFFLKKKKEHKKHNAETKISSIKLCNHGCYMPICHTYTSAIAVRYCQCWEGRKFLLTGG